MAPNVPENRAFLIDTGASGHFLQNSHSSILQHLSPCENFSIRLPNGKIIPASHTGHLPFSTDIALPSSATRAYVFPGLQISLISVGLLCDAGCRAVFTSSTAHVTKYDRTLLTGHRFGPGWYLSATVFQPLLPQNLPPPPHNFACTIFKTTTNAERMAFYQLCLGSPSQSTLYRAVRAGYLHSFPNLTPSLVSKYFQLTPATAFGHLDRTRKNTRSSRLPPWEDSSTSHDPTPTAESNPTTVTLSMVSAASDLSGPFPKPTVTGDVALLLLYHRALNYICIEPVKGKSAIAHKEAYMKCIDRLRSTPAGRLIPHSTEIVDNALSDPLKTLMVSLGIRPVLVAPGNHRLNPAERCIRTAKNHCIAMRESTDPLFPPEAFPHLLPQAEQTLNMLRPCHLDPTRSAWEYLHGPYDFLSQPLAPPGHRVISFDSSTERGTWDPHGISGFNIGPALLSHYRCYKIYVPATRRTRITDTVAWLPRSDSLPIVEPQHHLPVANIPQFTLPDLQTPPAPSPSLPTLPIPSTEGALPTLSHEDPGPTVSPSSVDSSPIAETEGATTAAPRRSARSNKGRQPSRYAAATATVGPPHHPHLPTSPLTPSRAYSALRRGSHAAAWEKAFAEELDRLFFTTKSISWVRTGHLPAGRKASYANIVGAVKYTPTPQFRVRIAYGGDQSDFDGPRSSATVDIPTVKCLLNSIVSDDDADFMTVDVKDFYINTILPRPEFMWMPLRLIPIEYRPKLGMEFLAEDSRILLQVDKALYGLPQAGLLAQTELIAHLADHGFIQSPTTPCLFSHITDPSLRFVLWVDDFLIKYSRSRPEIADRLLTALAEKYPIKTHKAPDGRGIYLGLTIHRDRAARTLTISMPGYITRMFDELNLPGPANGQRVKSPLTYTPPSYKGGPQWEFTDDSPPATPSDRKLIERVVGKTLFLSIMVCPIIQCAVNRLASQQSNPTTSTLADCHRLLSFLRTFPNPTITYHASDMQLYIHSDASHHSEHASRSRAGGFFTLGKPVYEGINSHSRTAPSWVNGSVATISKIIPTVCAAASESEYAALYLNCQFGEGLRQTLQDLGHPQLQPTPVTYDNIVSGQIATKTCKIKRSKAIAARYHWVQDRIRMHHFHLDWKPGTSNLADFFTKAHPVHHFTSITPLYNSSPSTL